MEVENEKQAELWVCENCGRNSEIKKREEEIIKGNEELERRFKQLEKGIKNEK